MRDGGEKRKHAFYDIDSLPLTIIELYESQPHYVWMGAKCLREAVLKINDSELLGEKLWKEDIWIMKTYYCRKAQ